MDDAATLNPIHFNAETRKSPIKRLIEANETAFANKVALKERSGAEFFAIILGGFLLSFNAGFINGVCYSTVQGLSVSHLSGTTTKLGLTMSTGDINHMWTYSSLIFFFTVGSAISGFVIPSIEIVQMS